MTSCNLVEIYRHYITQQPREFKHLSHHCQNVRSYVQMYGVPYCRVALLSGISCMTDAEKGSRRNQRVRRNEITNSHTSNSAFLRTRFQANTSHLLQISVVGWFVGKQSLIRAQVFRVVALRQLVNGYTYFEKSLGKAREVSNSFPCYRKELCVYNEGQTGNPLQ
jgi:hypothetical protein